MRFGVQRDRDAAGGGDDGLVQGEGRRGDNDLLTGVQNAGDGGVQRLTGTGGDQNLRGFARKAADGLKGGNLASQVFHALIGGVVGAVLEEGSQGGGFDLLRSVEIRLA